MMKKLFTLLSILSIAFSLSAQSSSDMSYRRSSLYNILIIHPQQQYAEDVRAVYYQAPFPDKFNNHTLSVLSINSDIPNKNEEVDDITKFLNDNNIGQRLVAKWFDREKETGTFDIDLLSQRGLYDASIMDVEVSSLLKRGSTLLEDAGEEMIKNTFIVVYDIVYVDKEENAQKAKKTLGWIGQGAKLLGNFIPGIGAIANLVESTADLASSISDMISGFTVKVTSHLYQLEWNDEVANTFYTELYIPRGEQDNAKKEKWENSASLFKMKYIGSNTERSEKTVTRGLYSPQDVIRKVINRSMDKSLSSLQKDNEVFRVKVPIYKVEGDRISVKIGMKEGVSSSSVYEVLERSIDEKTGLTKYRKVGQARPVSSAIWDNRYMAAEEGADNSSLDHTEFEITSGSNIYAGMLIREGKSSGTAITVSAPANQQVAAVEPPSTVKEEPKPKVEKQTSVKTNSAFVGRTMITAGLGLDMTNISDFNIQRMSYSLSVGWMKRWGGYINFKTNGVFQNYEKSVYSPDYIWTTGEAKVPHLTIAAGAMFAIIPQLYVNLGAGYGRRQLLWEDMNYDWVKIGEYSTSGILLDLGINARLGKFTFGIGTSCIIDMSSGSDGVYVEPEIKIGIMF